MSRRFATLQFESDKGIAHVRLHRPDCKNAMSFQMMRELTEAAEAVRRDKTIRVVIVSGSAHTFCSGLDLQDLQKASKAWVAWELLKPGYSLFQAAALVWRDLPVPVIAAVEGHCLGAGVQLALAADAVIATAQSTWAVRETHWGIIPDMGLSVSAYGKVQGEWLRRLTYSAELFDGSTAHAAGFAGTLAEDPVQAALALAAQWQERSPDALNEAKRLLNAMTPCPRRLLRQEKHRQLRLLMGKNQGRAVAKGLGKNTEFLPRQWD